MILKVSNPSNLPLIDYRNLTPIQGKLKDLSVKNFEKLKGSFEKFGFRVPFMVWIPTKNETVNIEGEDVKIRKGRAYILDGHQRLHTLTTIQATPYELPYILIEASDFLEAKRLLLVITSQYGKITREGLDAFAWDLEGFEIDFAAFDALAEILNVDTEDDNPSSVLTQKKFTLEITLENESDKHDIIDLAVQKGFSYKLKVK